MSIREKTVRVKEINPLAKKIVRQILESPADSELRIDVARDRYKYPGANTFRQWTGEAVIAGLKEQGLTGVIFDTKASAEASATPVRSTFTDGIMRWHTNLQTLVFASTGAEVHALPQPKADVVAPNELAA